MARKNRRDLVNDAEVGLYQVSSRTVRRAFLMGNDPVAGHDRSYRKRVIEKRMEDLASVFAVEVCDYSISDNHSFAVLRIRPDLVRSWSDREVARRRLRVNRSTLPLEPEPSEEMIDRFVKDEQRVARARKTLSSLSDYMGCLKQSVACEANRRDGAIDNFWAGRFHSVPLQDEAQVVASSSYVNLQLIRAERAKGVADSEYTSAYVRLQDERGLDEHGRNERGRDERGRDERSDEGQPERSKNGPRSGWLQPVDSRVAVVMKGETGAELETGKNFSLGMKRGEATYDGAAEGRRSSNDGYVRLTLAEQRQVIESLLKFEQELQATQNRFLEPELPTVLERLGISAEHWSETIPRVRRRFNHELEWMAKMIAEANELQSIEKNAPNPD